MNPNDQPAVPLHRETFAMVRYSLPELLAELQQERVTGSLAMEKIQQTEIEGLFKAQPKRRRVETE